VCVVIARVTFIKFSQFFDFTVK